MLRLSLPLFLMSQCHYTISSRFPLFLYLFVTTLLCSMLRQSLPLFLTSLYYLFNVSIVSLSVYHVTILSLSSRFPLFHYLFVTSLLCFLCFDCFFLCFLRHYSISSRFPLFHYLFVTSL